MDLTISRALLDEIRRAAAASPNAEICGLLLGEGRKVEAIRHCANVASDPRGSFEVDPATLIATHRSARAGGPSLIGHFHSHPGGVATPSPRDASAAEPGSLWIIAGMDELACWLAVPGGRFVPVEITATQ